MGIANFAKEKRITTFAVFWKQFPFTYIVYL